MTESSSEAKFVYGNAAINAQAGDWVIARRESENWSEKLQCELDAWLLRSPAHAIAYLRIEASWSRADRLIALRLPRKAAAVSTGGKILARSAFGVAVLVAIGYLASPLIGADRASKSFSTSIGGHSIVTLKDGTKIELNTDTSIRVSDNAKERKLWLDHGEAYFVVRHDPERPFLLFMGRSRVFDIGTRFVARREGQKSRVAVEEGSIRFEANAANKQLTLIPGDVLVATSNSLSLSKKPKTDLAADLGWRSGVVTFRHATLADAASQLNRYDIRKIDVADDGARNVKISGTFPIRNLTLFSRLVSAGLGLHVNQRSDGITISSK